MKYHNPVLLFESVDGLQINPGGVYVDVTFGGGGHSREILSRLNSEGKLFAFDQDADALQNTIKDDRFVLIHENFRFININIIYNFNHCGNSCNGTIYYNSTYFSHISLVYNQRNTRIHG